MNEDAIKAAAVAYVAAGGVNEVPAIFLAMFREEVGHALAAEPQETVALIETLAKQEAEFAEVMVEPEPEAEAPAKPAKAAPAAKKTAKPKR